MAAEQEQDGPASAAAEQMDSRDQRRRSKDSTAGLLARATFEIAIVAIGILIAFAVDKARLGFEHRQQAREAQAALRSEIKLNRERLIRKIRMVNEASRLASAQPESVASLVSARRNRSVFLFDTAWSSAIQTDAIRWLDPAVRSAFSEAYQGQELSIEVERAETEHWTELAAFGPGSAAEERDQRIRVWLAYADRVLLGACRQLWRYETALGAHVPEGRRQVCDTFRVGDDPAKLYRAWGVSLRA